MKSRYSHIDFLRALGFLGIVAIHVLYFNFNSPLEGKLWDYLHFVVPILVFCSGYVLTIKTSLISWYKKRLIRLVLPYYVYIVIHVGLINLFPQWFSGIGIDGSMPSALHAFLFLPSVNVSWLPLLFIELMLVSPLLMYLNKIKKLYMYGIPAAIFTALLSMIHFPVSYYWYMWISWSLLVVLAMQIFQKERYSMYLLTSTVLFGLLYGLWTTFHHSIGVYDNEYPPNAYFLSYGALWVFVLLYVSRLSIFNSERMMRWYTYLSTYSYSLYFIHFIVLDFVLHARSIIGKNGAIIEFFIVLLLTILIRHGWNKLLYSYAKK